MIANTYDSPNDKGSNEYRAMLIWWTAIIALLALGIGTSIGGALLALHGKPVIEDSYYNKALHWDDHAAMVQASVALGWKTALEVGEAKTSAGERAVILRLTDRDSAPLDNASVQLACFHRAHALDLRQVELKRVEPGVYAASVPLERAGIWEFRLTARRPGAASTPDEIYIESLQREIP